MKKIKQTLAALAAVVILSGPAFAAPNVGEMAPDFTAVDVISGEEFKLSDHKDSTVVLEWTNHQCPYVIKHYDSGNMQKIQKETAEKGVKWVSIVSSAEGKQGFIDAAKAVALIEEQGASPTAKILDASGEIGKTYGAKTTPHVFVIKDGVIQYAGAIDSNSSPRASAIEGAENYILSAVNDLEAGQAVKTASTQPYGCSVKY